MTLKAYKDNPWTRTGDTNSVPDLKAEHGFNMFDDVHGYSLDAPNWILTGSSYGFDIDGDRICCPSSRARELQ